MTPEQLKASYGRQFEELPDTRDRGPTSDVTLTSTFESSVVGHGAADTRTWNVLGDSVETLGGGADAVGEVWSLRASEALYVGRRCGERLLFSVSGAAIRTSSSLGCSTNSRLRH